MAFALRVKRSLLLRALLPIAGLLIALLLIATPTAIYMQTQAARADLEEKALLFGKITAIGLSGPLWDLDNAQADQLLGALRSDPDFASARVLDAKGKLFAVDTAQTTEDVVKATENIVGNGGNVIGSLELSLSKSRSNDMIFRQTVSIIAVGSLALLIVTLALYLILRGAVRPITLMTMAMERLSGGILDIVIPAAGRQDEIGSMAKALDIFRLNALEVRRLSDERAILEKKTQEDRRSLLTRTADEFEKSVGTLLNMVASASNALRGRTGDLEQAVSVAESAVQAGSKAAAQTSENVTVVASAAEELAHSIRDISERVVQSAASAGETSSFADRTSATIRDLETQAQRIGEIVNLINMIAGQTNLLALNATIEAARAGEAGKGFAVVASEVKHLATQTAKATEDIASQVQQIQNVTNRAVHEVQGISEVAAKSREIAATIAAAVEEQSAATQEISGSATLAAKGSREVSQSVGLLGQNVSSAAQSTKIMLDATDNLTKQIEELNKQVKSFAVFIRSA